MKKNDFRNDKSLYRMDRNGANRHEHKWSRLIKYTSITRTRKCALQKQAECLHECLFQNALLFQLTTWPVGQCKCSSLLTKHPSAS